MSENLNSSQKVEEVPRLIPINQIIKYLIPYYTPTSFLLIALATACIVGVGLPLKGIPQVILMI